ncbi:helix-turn-helix domain-containing protein [Brachybacterium hainanense]|uniref:Helix-turn-helix domain-containing protein n=1 Tax=Brachybacterium hainanense TaxID=1541174 RepID=A0ABV6RC99_9MICO
MPAPSLAPGDGAAPGVVTVEAALWCRRGDPPPMESMHRHNDVEINVVVRGELHYLFAGRHLVVREGQIAAFWAAQPHGLVHSRPGDACWVHVPLQAVLGWNLPEAEMGAIARMEPLIIEAGTIGERLGSMVSLWVEEIEDPATAGIALLEIQATLRRIIRAAAAQGPRPEAGDLPPGRIGHVMRMAQCVVDRFREELTIADVAAAAHLAPSHAMTIFREALGVTLGEYITMCRVAEAQRLLLSTSMTSTEIAAEAGFGSLSSFYAHVGAACGMTPRQYRRQGR